MTFSLANVVEALNTTNKCYHLVSFSLTSVLTSFSTVFPKYFALYMSFSFDLTIITCLGISGIKCICVCVCQILALMWI